MTSWREAASKEAQADLDALLSAVLPAAQDELVRHGGFFPFGATMSTLDELDVALPDQPSRSQPAGAEVLEQLYATARRDADRLRAVAFVADVRAGDKDAVAVQLEHRDHISIGVLLSYRRNPITKKVRIGKLLATDGTARVWPYSATGGG